MLLNNIKVYLHPPRAHSFQEVFWSPPQQVSIKVNINVRDNDMPLMVVHGGIYQNVLGVHLGSFWCNLGFGNALLVELMGEILGMEIAISNNWADMSLESDSSLVLSALNNSSVVPWKIRNKWDNCLVKLHNFNFLLLTFLGKVTTVQIY